MNDEFWPGNYFNYFTEVEEHFQKARGTGLFLVSPLDWALIECWKEAGVPLEAVLRGIDEAFEKWRGRKSKFRSINSLAYCAQAVIEQAQIMAGSAPPAAPRTVAPPFELEELRSYLAANAAALRQAGSEEVAVALDRLAAEAESHYANLEDLERRLAALEDKMIARSPHPPDRRRPGGRAPRIRPPAPPLPRQDDRRPNLDAGAPVPGPPFARIRRAAPPQPVLSALTQRFSVPLRLSWKYVERPSAGAPNPAPQPHVHRRGPVVAGTGHWREYVDLSRCWTK